ncbi:MAG: AIPR family protein [Dehalococcoidia bacterium]|nr:AIPR family protein [Dehalococcoidia bacterium]
MSKEDVRAVTRIDGGGDKGIDGWHIDPDASEPFLLLVQSKDTEAEVEDLLKLRHGFEMLFDPEGRRSANTEAQERASELERLKLENLEVRFRLVTSDIANFESDLRGLAKRYPSVQVGEYTYPCTYDVYDVERLAREIRVIDEEPITATFELSAADYFEHRTAGGYRTVTATVPADQLVGLFDQYRTNLFRHNPRYYLSPTTTPNKEMREKLESEDRVNFFLFNNGVTAVSQGVSKPTGRRGVDTIKITANNFQIVNGCQTTVTLHSVSRRQNLSGVRVLLRILEASNYDAMARQIARASNTQNRMKESDLKSTDDLQKRLHGEFQLLRPAWFFEYKRGVWATEYKRKDAREPFEGDGEVRKLAKEDAAQACLAFLGQPTEAAESAGAIFSSDDRYERVFPERVRAEQILFAHQLYRLAEAYTATRRGKHSWADYLRFPLVACVSRLIHEITGTPPDGQGHLVYFSAADSEKLRNTATEWAPGIIEKAFEALSTEVEKRLHTEEIGPRSLVRQRGWWEEPYGDLKSRFLGQIEYERELGDEARRQGVETRLGFTAKFPLPIRD